jgi:heat shock protein HslJ
MNDLETTGRATIGARGRLLAPAASGRFGRAGGLLALAGAAALVLAGCATTGPADGAGSGADADGGAGDAAPVELTGSWQLASGADGEGEFWPADIDRPVTIEFTDNGITGTAACNGYGTIAKDAEQADPLRTGDVSLGDIASTKMACEPSVMTVETRYLGALAEVETAEMDSETLLLTGEGVSLTFEPMRASTQDDGGAGDTGTGDDVDTDVMDQ